MARTTNPIHLERLVRAHHVAVHRPAPPRPPLGGGEQPRELGTALVADASADERRALEVTAGSVAIQENAAETALEQALTGPTNTVSLETIRGDRQTGEDDGGDARTHQYREFYSVVCRRGAGLLARYLLLDAMPLASDPT